MIDEGAWRVGALAMLLMGASSACSVSESTSDEVPEGEWVGTLAGTDAWVAISVADGVAAAYVCGGPQTLSTYTRWWRADVGDGALSMDADGWQLTTSLSEGTISGSLTDPNGVLANFDADFSVTGELPGIFGAFMSGCRSGVIVQSASSSQGAFCDGIDFVSEVTPLMPIDAAGFTVTADTVQGSVEFLVEPIVPSEVVQ